MNRGQLIGWRVVCGAAVDTFTVRSAAGDCITHLRRAGRPVTGFLVRRINGREVVTRLRIRSAKQPAQQQGATHGQEQH